MMEVLEFGSLSSETSNVLLIGETKAQADCPGLQLRLHGLIPILARS